MTHFDESAKDWDSDPQKIERARVVANAIRTSIPLRPDMTALEVGCGTGLLSFALQTDFVSITLADTSEAMLSVLHDKIQATGAKSMTPVQLDLLSDPLPSSRFDVSYSLMTLHHIPDTRAFLDKLAAVLNPGGWLCIADLDSENGAFHGEGVTNVHLGFDRDELRNWVHAAGFEDVTFSTVFVIHKQESAFPVFLLTARKSG